jgi:hypothetical protein
MEHLTSLVSSRGLLKSSHSHNRNPISSSSQIDIDLLRDHSHGRSIYVCTDAIHNFAENFYHHIEEAFVLVSGDGDTAVDTAMLNEPKIAAMLESDLLLSWYAQNLTVDHPKLNHLPIGLDYHTMWERPGTWGISAISAIAQENTLLNTLARAPAFSERYMNGYCNWRPVAGWGDREACYAQIDRSVCLFESGSISRTSTWQRQSEFMFVVSPEGVGTDCHRTWEAILLGCVPIIKRNTISKLFENLPVLLVDQWEDVTHETMRAYSSTLPTKTFEFSVLFREHWLLHMSGKRSRLLPLMTQAEFRKFMTKITG